MVPVFEGVLLTFGVESFKDFQYTYLMGLELGLSRVRIINVTNILRLEVIISMENLC